jgi:hypothetical protein
MTLVVDFHQAQTFSKRKTEVNMSEVTHITRATQYANSDDFCRIFDEDMNDLYLLSFLLTADRGRAEQCFVSGFEDAVEGNAVFKEWARSWARRAIIQNAVRLIDPRPREDSDGSPSSSASSSDKSLPAGQHVEIAAVLELESFDRLVYVITVLEHYSDQDCSLLLGCVRRDVLAARIRALRQIGSAVELQYRQLPNAGSQKLSSLEHRSSIPDLLGATRLVTSA